MPHAKKNSVINDDLGGMQNGHLHDALGVWRSKVSDTGHLPRIQDLSPFDFMRQLGRVSVISVEKHTEQVRFRWRLQGSAVHLGTASLHGEWAKDWTGRCIDEVPMPEYKVDASNGMLASVSLSKPVHVTFSGIFDSDYEMNYEVLVLPWGAKRQVERLLLVSRPLAAETSLIWNSNAPASVDLYHSKS